MTSFVDEQVRGVRRIVQEGLLEMPFGHKEQLDREQRREKVEFRKKFPTDGASLFVPFLKKVLPKENSSLLLRIF
jgi:hypothetical protein